MAELKASRAGAGVDGDLWSGLRQLTPARIGLGRVGGSQPTAPLLDFDLAHARARDAVHAAFEVEPLLRDLEASGFAAPLVVASEVRSRMEYLLRPDRGRILDETSRVRLQEHAKATGSCDLALVIADGLSAVAPARHAVPLLREWRCQSTGTLPANVTLVVAHCARVGLGDAIGEILQAKAVVVLLGERPGLSSPDSLGAYLTWAPRAGRTDAERNCISNIRPEGLPYIDAARKLNWLLSEAQRLQISGVALKDDSEEATSLPQQRPDELGL